MADTIVACMKEGGQMHITNCIPPFFIPILNCCVEMGWYSNQICQCMDCE